MRCSQMTQSLALMPPFRVTSQGERLRAAARVASSGRGGAPGEIEGGSVGPKPDPPGLDGVHPHHWNVIRRASVKLLVLPASRNHAWKFHLSPAITVPPGGLGRLERSGVKGPRMPAMSAVRI